MSCHAACGIIRRTHTRHMHTVLRPVSQICYTAPSLDKLLQLHHGRWLCWERKHESVAGVIEVEPPQRVALSLFRYRLVLHPLSSILV